jgi:hypothetical protein
MKTEITNLTEDAVIKETRAHFEAAQAALRKGCEHALLTGLRLIWLHGNTASQGARNDRTSSHVLRSQKGFEAALTEIGINKMTAYRWMNATRAACVRATLIFQDDDIAGELPEPGTPAWERWDQQLKSIAQGMSLNRLMLGTSQASTEEHRYDELISADEEGRGRAADLLAGVASGKYTLVQAVRALGSQEAYDRLRAEGGEKVRKDPVYLTMNGDTGKVGGLFVNSLVTLKNTFSHWDDTPPAARKKARELWLDVVAEMPADLRNG